VPGTDHAGIATQNVVERELAKEGKTRQDLGREAFVDRVWEWRERYGSQIVAQLKRLGCSSDWSRIRFTMDPGLSRAVRKVFVDLFDEGLIYRGNRIINWCPRCGTAIADVELDHSEHEGSWWSSATRSRAAPPTGPRRHHRGHHAARDHARRHGHRREPQRCPLRRLVGRNALHPFSGRRLPSSPTRRSIRPSAPARSRSRRLTTRRLRDRRAARPGEHQHPRRPGPGQRGGRPFCRPGPPRGSGGGPGGPRRAGLLVGSIPHRYAIARCSRCATVVEPWLSEQWFVRMEPLARPPSRRSSRGAPASTRSAGPSTT